MQATKNILIKRTSLPKRVVATLSRTGVSARELKDVLRLLRSINTHGMYKSAIPADKHFIFEELAKDGIILKTMEEGKVLFVSTTE